MGVDEEEEEENRLDLCHSYSFFNYFISTNKYKVFSMASNDNPRLPLTSGTSPVVKYTEMRNQTDSPSTTITISNTPPVSPPFVDSNRLTKDNSLSVNNYELRRLPTRQRRVVKKTLMANVGYRLAKRKELHIQR